MSDIREPESPIHPHGHKLVQFQRYIFIIIILVTRTFKDPVKPSGLCFLIFIKF
jgi:hypothetical protein